MSSNLDLAAFNRFNNDRETPLEARRQASHMFRKALSRGLWRSFLGRLVGSGNSYLRDLSEDAAGTKRLPAQSMTIETVALVSITGSEGRCTDFDRDFCPLKMHNRERWIGIAAARRGGAVLPPVELIQFGDIYYVRDGHHRISVAKALGQVEIEAQIVYRLVS